MIIHQNKKSVFSAIGTAFVLGAVLAASTVFSFSEPRGGEAGGALSVLTKPDTAALAAEVKNLQALFLSTF